MRNHLRIALKHLIGSPEAVTEIISGNYKVCRKTCHGSTCIAINRLKYKGVREFHTCEWDMLGKTVYICEGEKCPAEEIVFIHRTIKKLGYEIEHIVNHSNDEQSRLAMETMETG